MKRKEIKYTEFIAIPATLIIGLFVVLTFPSLSLNSSFIPETVQGLATVTGVLIGFSTFSVSLGYTNNKNKAYKKWAENRLQFLITLIVVSILFVWLSFVTLAQGILIHAFYWSQLGFVIVIPLIFETIILLSGYSEP